MVTAAEQREAKELILRLARQGGIQARINDNGDIELISGVALKIPVHEKVARGDLVAGAENSISFAWENPHNKAIAAWAILDITTEATAAVTMDVGRVADAESTGDTMLDGADVGTAPATHCSIATATGNGTGLVHVIDAKGGANSFITGKILGNAATGMVGTYEIHYVLVGG
jgi:hypothetical protein